jgi:hypothetical protein
MKRFAAILLPVCLVTACKRAPSANSPASPEPATPRAAATPAIESVDIPVTPRALLERICQLRQAGALDELGQHIVPEQRELVIDHLLSVDRLVIAYQALNHVISERIGAGSATILDPHAMANIVGVFSPDIEIVDEALLGDEAVVTISVAGRLPLEKVTLVRRNDRWLLRTDPPVPELSAELRNLAKAADRVALEIKTRPMTAEDVRRELALRHEPILQRIQEIEKRHAASPPPGR